MKSSKQSYRAYFDDVRRYVKMTVILDEIGENKTNFSRFMQGQQFDYYLSLDKLYKIEKAVQNTLDNLTS